MGFLTLFARTYLGLLVRGPDVWLDLYLCEKNYPSNLLSV
jgi:hypothetical protein